MAITNEPASPLAAAAELQPANPRRTRARGAGDEDVRHRAGGARGAVANAVRPTPALADGLAALPDATARHDRTDAANGWRDPAPAAIEAFAAADRALLVSRGFNLATALELALKLKETCGLFAEAYSTADFMHGPLVLAQRRRADARDPAATARWAPTSTRPWPRSPHAAGGRRCSAAPRRRAGRVRSSLPHSLPEALTPLLFVVPGQLLVEATAGERGVNPDAPDGLGKVTLTR